MCSPGFAGQRDLIRLFATGGDAYRHMAAEIYGRSADTIAKGSVERQLGKQAVLGCGYGIGAPKFRTTCANAGIRSMKLWPSAWFRPTARPTVAS